MINLSVLACTSVCLGARVHLLTALSEGPQETADRAPQVLL